MNCYFWLRVALTLGACRAYATGLCEDEGLGAATRPRGIEEVPRPKPPGMGKTRSSCHRGLSNHSCDIFGNLHLYHKKWSPFPTALGSLSMPGEPMVVEQPEGRDLDAVTAQHGPCSSRQSWGCVRVRAFGRMQASCTCFLLNSPSGRPKAGLACPPCVCVVCVSAHLGGRER